MNIESILRLAEDTLTFIEEVEKEENTTSAKLAYLVSWRAEPLYNLGFHPYFENNQTIRSMVSSFIPARSNIHRNGMETVAAGVVYLSNFKEGLREVISIIKNEPFNVVS